MVFFFQSKFYPDSAVIYMGKDKYENEDLIKYSFPKDVWFHVENLSSAHVYLRLDGLQDLDSIPDKLLEEMCQLTKFNSIEGSKKKEVGVIYTFAENLYKDATMEAGAVSYKNPKAKRFIKHVLANKEILYPVKKTKTEAFPDLQAEYSAKMQELKMEAQSIKTKMKMEEKKQEMEAKQAIKEAKDAKKQKEKAYEEFFAQADDDEEEKKEEVKEDLIDDFW